MTEVGIAGTTPYARKEVVRLEHPYRKVIREAMVAAYNRVMSRTLIFLWNSPMSPIPKDTGLLRSMTQIEYRPSASGITLLIQWGGVPYARHLIERAGSINVRHEKDPMAFADFREPTMRMVWTDFYVALMQELSLRGVEFTTKGGLEALGINTGGQQTLG